METPFLYQKWGQKSSADYVQPFGKGVITEGFGFTGSLVDKEKGVNR